MVTVLGNHPRIRFQFKKGPSNFSYEHRTYESVDDKSGEPIQGYTQTKQWKTEFVSERVNQ